MVRAARDVGTEEVEQLIAAVAMHLGDEWIAVDLQGGGQRLQHSHPGGPCPKACKVTFQGRAAVRLQMKGKFCCANQGCQRSWSSAMALLLVTVQPSRGGVYKFSITALEQGCQRCGRDVYARMYADEAGRVADWLTDAYIYQTYPERPQRGSNMRRPHDKKRCTACKAGLH